MYDKIRGPDTVGSYGADASAKDSGDAVDMLRSCPRREGYQLSPAQTILQRGTEETKRSRQHAAIVLVIIS